MSKNNGSDNMIHLPACPGKKDVPSEKEKECLMAMKAIKERVRKLKGQAKAIEGSRSSDDIDQIPKIKDELKSLKSEWNGWEEKRLKAEKERMILLGHEKDPEMK